jgi:hypothetical protein
MVELSLGVRTPVVSYFEPKDSKSDWRNAWEKKNWNGNSIVVHHDIDPYFMIANSDDVERTYIFKIGVSQELIAKMVELEKAMKEERERKIKENEARKMKEMEEKVRKDLEAKAKKEEDIRLKKATEEKRKRDAVERKKKME